MGGQGLLRNRTPYQSRNPRIRQGRIGTREDCADRRSPETSAASTSVVAHIGGMIPTMPTAMPKRSCTRPSIACSLAPPGERGQGPTRDLLRRVSANLFDGELEGSKRLCRDNNAVAFGQFRNRPGLARLDHLLGNIPGLGLGVERDRQQHLCADRNRLR